MFDSSTLALAGTAALWISSIGAWSNAEAKGARVAALYAQKRQFQTNIYRNDDTLRIFTADKYDPFLLDISSSPHIVWVRAERQASLSPGVEKSPNSCLDHDHQRHLDHADKHVNNDTDATIIGSTREGVGLAMSMGFRLSPNFTCTQIPGSDVRIVRDEICQSRAALRKIVDATNIGPMSRLFDTDVFVSWLGVRTWPRLRSHTNVQIVGSANDDDDEEDNISGTTTNGNKIGGLVPAPPYRVTSYTVPGLLFSVSRDQTGHRQFTVHAASTSSSALADHTFDRAIYEARCAETTANVLFGASVCALMVSAGASVLFSNKS